MLNRFADDYSNKGQISIDNMNDEQSQNRLKEIIAIAEAMAQKYVVVTNPPYMGSSGMNAKVSEYIKKNYSDSKSDLFAVFIEKCLRMTKQSAYTAMITQHAFMFLSSFEKLRSKLFHYDFINMAHLGARAFEEIAGEVVQTTSFVMRKSKINKYKATYARLVDYNNQHEKETAFLKKGNLHTAQIINFSKIPGSPIAYWVSNKAIVAYDKGKLLGDIAFPKTGMTTGDNNRFLRFWYEIDVRKAKFDSKNSLEAAQSIKKWFPYCKGGGYRRWYGYNEYLVNWECNGFEIKNKIKDNGLKGS